jgi:hypothetical protein
MPARCRNLFLDPFEDILTKGYERHVSVPALLSMKSRVGAQAAYRLFRRAGDPGSNIISEA